MRHCLSILVAIVLCLPSVSVALVINVPGDFSSVADAVDAAVVGDTVLIQPGVHAGHSMYFVPGLTVIGATGDPSDVVIDAQFQGRLFNCYNSTGVYVSGITMRNGFSGYSKGGGLYLYNSDVTFENCVLEDCTAYEDGGGVYVWDTSGAFRDVVFRRNATQLGDHDGGGVYSNVADIMFERVLFESNSCAGSGGGLHCRGQLTPELVDVDFVGNISPQGGGMRCYNASTHITGATFISNMAPDGGEGGGIFCGPSCQPLLSDVVFEGNSATRGGAIACRDAGDAELEYVVVFENEAEMQGGGLYACNASPVLANVTLCSNHTDGEGGNVFAAGSSSWFARTLIAYSTSGHGIYSNNSYPLLTCSNVFGNDEADYGGGVPDQTGLVGNISSDPMLCDIATGDLSIAEQSPCASGNNGCGYLIGALGIGCAPSAVQEMSWGALKALYR